MFDVCVRDEAEIAVVGGGIAGSTIALYLSQLGLNVSLFEKGPSLVNGPPICHLHAGGNLYREISDNQCVTLLKESIELVRFYPDSVDYRPTVIAVPCDDSGKPEELFPRLALLQSEYEALIRKDAGNKVLGESRDYFKIYEREHVETLKKKTPLDKPLDMDDWMIPVAQNIDLDKVQFPLIMVQEYGLNVFRLAASVTLALKNSSHCELLLGHEVIDVNAFENAYDLRYIYQGKQKEKKFDFLINAAGFRSGMLDDLLGFKRERLVEFKAAYVSQWDVGQTVWPEIIFYGERGTPKGMAQFTPYPNGYVQLHGMTKEITLFNDGLVKSCERSSQPKLTDKLLHKIDSEWSFSQAKQRSQGAINHLAQYIPAFQQAKVVSKPLYGAQQIPGEDATLRAADVSFEGERYARCEIVKASSVLSMADAITKQLIDLGYVSSDKCGKRSFFNNHINEDDISLYAQELCLNRAYPSSLAKRIKTVS